MSLPGYDAWLEPPDPCCDLPGCDGTLCRDDADDAREQHDADRADAERDQRHG